MVVRDVGGRRRRAPDQNDAWRPSRVPAASGGLDLSSLPDLNGRVASLLSEALRADDAEASGFDARDLVSDPGRAVGVLGGGESPVARHAVVQRFGGVGALLVVACEECWRRLHAPDSSVDRDSSDHRDSSADRNSSDHESSSDDEAPDRLQADLRRLLDLFGDLGAEEMVELVGSIENAACEPSVASGAVDTRVDDDARRWLHVTYAVAARDGTDEAHRAYVSALDRVLALKRRLSFV